MIISADKTKYGPNEMKIIEGVISPIPLVLVTRTDDFVFNDGLDGIGDYCLVDCCEYEWNRVLTNTHLFGVNTKDFSYRFPGDEWLKFDKWVSSHPPTLYFKRELLEKDATDTIIPIDYPCYAGDVPIQRKKDFDSRSISVFNFWGRSSEERVRLHADFWLRSSHNGASICDNIHILNTFLEREENPNKWVTFNFPHYYRVDIGSILYYNGLSKLSVSMKGAGNKCFRHSEVPVNSIMVMEDAGIKFAYDWVHGQNCITYRDDPIGAIEAALKRDDLYEIYVSGVETLDKYRTANYNKYIEDKIKEAL